MKLLFSHFFVVSEKALNHWRHHKEVWKWKFHLNVFFVRTGRVKIPVLFHYRFNICYSGRFLKIFSQISSSLAHHLFKNLLGNWGLIGRIWGDNWLSTKQGKSMVEPFIEIKPFLSCFLMVKLSEPWPAPTLKESEGLIKDISLKGGCLEWVWETKSPKPFHFNT